jgi:hypothetical protein
MGVDRSKRRRIGSWLFLLGWLLAPSLLQGQTLTCTKTGDTTVSVLELEAGGVNRVTGFTPDERAYHVWLPGGPTILRAQPSDPGSKVTYQYADANGAAGGLIGVGGGEITLDISHDLSTPGSANRVLSYLAEGIAYASIDYRLLQDFDPDGVIKPLSDSARCLQFIRYHAAQLNIDPERMILMGGSAGAGTSLWIGFHGDMADFVNADPVLRQSTRVTAVVAISTQATYELGKWTTVVFAEYNLDLFQVAAQLGLTQRLLDFYGITDIEDFDSPEILAYRAEVDMLGLMDAEDTPFYVQNDLEPATAPLTVNLLYHHANHALVLAEQADAIGLENVAYMKALGIADPSGEDSLEFSLRHLGL